MKSSLEEMAVKEAKVFMKTVSEGLKSLAKGVEALARQVDGLAEQDQAKKPASPSAARKKTGKKPVAKPVKAAKKKKRATAYETVYTLISRSKKGISTQTLCEKTGFDKKKIHNIIYRLKKQESIRSVAKGVYVKS